MNPKQEQEVCAVTGGCSGWVSMVPETLSSLEVKKKKGRKKLVLDTTVQQFGIVDDKMEKKNDGDVDRKLERKRN
jgi:hypothetical protein